MHGALSTYTLTLGAALAMVVAPEGNRMAVAPEGNLMFVEPQGT